jgi:predicted membrane protein
MRRLFKIKYPKILIFVLAIVLAYILFRNPEINSFISNLGKLGYWGLLIAGILFAFGFTAPFAVGFFLTLNPENILIAGIIAGLGATISNIFIFKTIKSSFSDEFEDFKKTKLYKEVYHISHKKLHGKIKLYLSYVFAGILIASPLPDEMGDAMLAGLTKINIILLALIWFTLSTIGILIILGI